MGRHRTPTASLETAELQEGLCEVYATEAWALVTDEIERVVSRVRSAILDGTRTDFQTLQGMRQIVKAVYTAAGAEVPEHLERLFK